MSANGTGNFPSFEKYFLPIFARVMWSFGLELWNREFQYQRLTGTLFERAARVLLTPERP